jgi:hypothetical protein
MDESKGYVAAHREAEVVSRLATIKIEAKSVSKILQIIATVRL